MSTTVLYEKLHNVCFDIKKLVFHYETYVKPLPIVLQPGLGGNGGWSVLSNDSDYRSGWQMGALCFNENKIEIDMERASRMGVLKPTYFDKPTQICHGYLLEVIEKIRQLGLSPVRARIALMRPGQDTRWHRDATDLTYLVRLHIPIVTNKDVTWHTKSGQFHLPADGSAYLMPVNNLHLVKNLGSTDRIHLFMDVNDTHGKSKNFAKICNLNIS